MKQSRWIVGRHVLYFGDLRQLRSGMHASEPPRHRTSMQTNKQTNKQWLLYTGDNTAGQIDPAAHDAGAYARWFAGSRR
jgi:hypothetical protein